MCDGWEKVTCVWVQAADEVSQEGCRTSVVQRWQTNRSLHKRWTWKSVYSASQIHQFCCSCIIVYHSSSFTFKIIIGRFEIKLFLNMCDVAFVFIKWIMHKYRLLHLCRWICQFFHFTMSDKCTRIIYYLFIVVIASLSTADHWHTGVCSCKPAAVPSDQVYRLPAWLDLCVLLFVCARHG